MITTSNTIVKNALFAINFYSGPLFKCPQCKATGHPYDGFCRKCGYILPRQDMAQRAEELLIRELRNKTHNDIKGIAYVKGIGRIDLDVGHKGSGKGQDGGSGLIKLLQKHERDLNGVPWTFTIGKVADLDEESKAEGKIGMIHGPYLGILGKRAKGASIISHQKRAKKAASYENRP